MDQAKDPRGHAGAGLAVGAGLGLIFGIMFEQIALGVALGLSVGAVADLSRKKAVPKE